MRLQTPPTTSLVYIHFLIIQNHRFTFPFSRNKPNFFSLHPGHSAYTNQVLYIWTIRSIGCYYNLNRIRIKLSLTVSSAYSKFPLFLLLSLPCAWRLMGIEKLKTQPGIKKRAGVGRKRREERKYTNWRHRQRERTPVSYLSTHQHHRPSLQASERAA